MRKIALASVFVAGQLVPLCAQAQGPQSGARLTLCRAGPVSPSARPDIGTISTATCPYDDAGIAARVEHLIERSVNTPMDHIGLAQQFGLPGMKAVRSEPRIVAYATKVSGKDWGVMFTLAEAAFPLRADLPVVFGTGPKPRRLAALDKVDVQIELAIDINDDARGPDRCLTAARLGTVAKAAGWEDITALSQILVTDGGPGYPLYRAGAGRVLTFTLDRQQGRLPTEAELESSCVRKVSIGFPPDSAEGRSRRGVPFP